MTGEITLRGRVLPIGGLKSKILAAHLSGARMVVIPEEEREGPARHPRRDPQADEARARRDDGPGPRDGPAAPAEAAAGDAEGPGRSRAEKEPEGDAPIRRPTSRRTSQRSSS